MKFNEFKIDTSYIIHFEYRNEKNEKRCVNKTGKDLTTEWFEDRCKYPESGKPILNLAFYSKTGYPVQICFDDEITFGELMFALYKIIKEK